MENNLTATGRYVQNLANKHNIVYKETAFDRLADIITDLSDDDIQTDSTENLIIELCKSGIINDKTALKLLNAHLDEKFNV